MYKKNIRNHENKFIYDRNITIYPKLIGMVLNIHNGRRFIKVNIVKEMIGHKLGEFAKTRTTPKHPTKKKK